MPGTVLDSLNNSDVLGAELCLYKMPMLKSQPLGPQNVTVFGGGVFKEITKVK